MINAEPGFSIRILKPHEWATYRQVRLCSLADSPDAFGSTLEVERDRSPDEWAARLHAGNLSGKDYPLVAERGGAVVGLVWAKVDPEIPTVANVFQMWVAPECRGCGIATTLLRAVVQWAKTRHTTVIQLGVTCGDTSAVRLYLREGFRAFGPPAPLRAGSPLLAQTMRLIIDEGVA